jgi:hypothetical protein
MQRKVINSIGIVNKFINLIMKKILFLTWLVILICNFTNAQNEVMKKKALSFMNSLKVQDYYKDATSELYNDYANLKIENAELEKKVKTLEFQNRRIDCELEYLKLREQIELDHIEQNNLNPLINIYSINSSYKQMVINFYQNGPCPECKNLFNIESTSFKKLYPKIYGLVLNGSIILRDTFYEEVVQMQVKRVSFPHLIVPPKSSSEQKSMAELYLKFIKDISSDRAFDFDVYTLYTQIEKEKVPNKELEKLITIREQFIIYLKQLYNAKK